VSEVDRTEFRRLLEAKHKELLSTTSNRDGIVIEITADEIDGLQQQLSREMAIRNLDHASKLLKSVQAALDRIRDETYGVCLHCEEVIPEKRLKAVPWALYCVSCQEIIDRDRAFGEHDSNASGFAA
jgi:RNA polymerase-binding transcription factor